MLRTRILRSSLAPVLFAAAITGCTNTDVTPAPATAPAGHLAVPLADAHSAAAPRFFRGGSMPARPAATVTESAMAHVQALAPQWGARRGTADLSPIATLEVEGGQIVRLRQALDGIPVERGELRVMVGQGGTLVAASGTVTPAELLRDRDGFLAGSVSDGRLAVARAIAAVHGVTMPASALVARMGKSDPADPATWVAGTAAGVHVSQARARKAWYRAGDALAAAWIVEAYSGPADSTESRLHRVIVAARGGRILEQRDLTVDANHDYRVWADPTGDRRPLDGPTADFSPHPTGTPNGTRPAYIAPSLVTVDGLNDNGAGGTDPWLPAGATETVGNNVDTYADLASPSGLGGTDFRAATTAAGVFDRVYDTAAAPTVSQAQQMASLTQLFYSINWLHDEWYDAGFDEAAANGQEDNYGRGGVDGDRILAEAQDFSGRNNANMSTPEDGMNPRMQVFLWNGAAQQSLTLSSVATPVVTSGASYGPPSYDVSGTVVAGSDGAGVSTTDGCEPITNNVAGRLVLLDRGNCTFKTKTLRVQEAGGIGMILANNTGTTPPSLSNDPNITTPITIPSMGMSMSDGAALRGALAAGAVTSRLFRQQAVDNDGGLDGGLVAHEFGHYVHHRLSVCGTVMCGGMSEGWADFIALHMMVRPGDDLDGTYGVSGYAFSGDPYFGIRRAPYSVDMTKNAMTYRMVADGEALPGTHPLSGGGPNAEVHNTGEIWAQAMWEVYVALQEMPGADFVATRAKMARYIVAGLSIAPPDGTFTEIRDALLAAAFIASPADHDVMAAAFARRGLGTCAASPPRSSVDNVGAIESFEVSARALPGLPVLTLTNDCDADGSLDAGDTATLTVPLVNAGALALTGGATVAVTTATSGLTVPSAPVSLAAIAPYGNAVATFEITASADLGAGPVAGAIDITVTAAGCAPTTTFSVPLRLQTDTTAAASATDAFDAVPSIWTTDGDEAAQVWSHTVESGLDRRWAGADHGAVSDTSLVSPVMTAHATEPVTVTFDHAHSFEFSQDTYFDGGLVEITTDGGSTWSDVAIYTSPGYTGPLGTESNNPLGGRDVYGSTNPSYPATDRVTLSFGTQLAGQTFQLRFRIATDAGVGDEGWKIDDLTATGITGTPFPVQTGDDGAACGGPGPDGGTEMPGEEPGGCCSTGGGARPGDVLAGLLAGAALLFRSRRRRARAAR